MEKIDIVLKKMDRMDQRLSKIEERLELITEIDENCSKMGEHIEFIDGIYSKVRSPFEKLMNLVNRTNITTRQNIYLEDNPKNNSQKR